jgi:lipopolysaccharide-induced tumor necrosis factor-alpha factor
MNQYPQSPDVTQQPPVYAQDPNQQQYQQGQPMYAQPQQPQYTGAGSPVPQQPQGAFVQPQQTGFDQTKGQGHPGMPPQAQSGTTYQNATPIASLNRGPAPADCPACGQRAMTNVAFETGNTTQ